MRELQLIRSADDKRRLDLEGVGSVRFENMWGTKLAFSAPALDDLRIDGKGPFRRADVATDAAGHTVATLSCGRDKGRVECGDRVVDVTGPLRGVLERRHPFEITENARDIARVASRVWDEKPIDVTLIDEEFATRDPLLFLLALYVGNLVAASRSARAAAGVE